MSSTQAKVRMNIATTKTPPLLLLLVCLCLLPTATHAWWDVIFGCQSGYEMNSQGLCVDIDECARSSSPCSGPDEMCYNIIGSHRCIIRPDCGLNFDQDPLTRVCTCPEDRGFVLGTFTGQVAELTCVCRGTRYEIVTSSQDLFGGKPYCACPRRMHFDTATQDCAMNPCRDARDSSVILTDQHRRESDRRCAWDPCPLSQVRSLSRQSTCGAKRR